MSNLSIYHLVDTNGAFFLYIPRCTLNDSRVQQFKKDTQSKVIMCDMASITDYGFLYQEYNEWIGATFKTYIPFTRIRELEEIIFNKQEDKHD